MVLPAALDQTVGMTGTGSSLDAGERAAVPTAHYAPVRRSFCSSAPLILDLLNHLLEVVTRRVLHGRELHIGLEFLEPQRLADREHVPVIDVSCRRRCNRAGHAEERLDLLTDGGFERITLDVDDLCPVIGQGP